MVFWTQNVCKRCVTFSALLTSSFPRGSAPTTGVSVNSIYPSPKMVLRPKVASAAKSVSNTTESTRRDEAMLQRRDRRGWTGRGALDDFEAGHRVRGQPAAPQHRHRRWKNIQAFWTGADSGAGSRGCLVLDIWNWQSPRRAFLAFVVSSSAFPSNHPPPFSSRARSRRRCKSRSEPPVAPWHKRRSLRRPTFRSTSTMALVFLAFPELRCVCQNHGRNENILKMEFWTHMDLFWDGIRLPSSRTD